MKNALVIGLTVLILHMLVACSSFEQKIPTQSNTGLSLETNNECILLYTTQTNTNDTLDWLITEFNSGRQINSNVPIDPVDGILIFDTNSPASYISNYINESQLNFQGYSMDPYYPYYASEFIVVPFGRKEGFTGSDYPLSWFIESAEYKLVFDNDEGFSLQSYLTEQSYGRYCLKVKFINSDPLISPLQDYSNQYAALSPLLQEVTKHLEESDVISSIKKEGSYQNIGVLPPIVLLGPWNDSEQYGMAVSKLEPIEFGTYDAICSRIMLIGRMGNIKSEYKYATSAVAMHELGHLFGLPDLYQIKVDNVDNSIAPYDFMVGNMRISGFHRWLFGWTPFIRINYSINNLCQMSAELPGNQREVYITDGNGLKDDEFFLLDNFAYLGDYYMYRYEYDAPISSDGHRGGLGIWHLDMSCLLRDSNENHPYIALERANGEPQWLPEMQIKIDDLYYGYEEYYLQKEKSEYEFTVTSIPSSNYYDGSSSGINITNIHPVENYWNWSKQNKYDTPSSNLIYNVDVGKPLFGDFNGDGIVNEGDEAMLRANLGRKVGVDALRVPVDVNGDGLAGLARDRDGDGFIATSERIYDDNWTLVHTTGDWLDLNCDGRNDLDCDGNGQWDEIDRFLDEYGGIPWVIANYDKPHSGNTTYGKGISRTKPIPAVGAPKTGHITGDDLGSSRQTAVIRFTDEGMTTGAQAIDAGGNGGALMTGSSTGDSRGVSASARGLTIRVPSSTFDGDLFDVGAATIGGVDVRSLSVPMLILDNEGDGCLTMLDADLDGVPDLVPARLDPDGDGVVTEADAAYMGYYWGETTFEELWIPLPAPSWAE